MSAARLALSFVALAFCSACGQPPPTEGAPATRSTATASAQSTQATPVENKPASPFRSDGVNGQVLNPPGSPGWPGGPADPSSQRPTPKPEVAGSPAKYLAEKSEFERAVEASRSAHVAATIRLAGEYGKKLAGIQDEETKAGNLDGALLVRGERKSLEKRFQQGMHVATKADLAAFLTNTQWEWDENRLQLSEKGIVTHLGFNASKLAVRWEAIDRRTVLLTITKGRDRDRVAILQFNESIDSVQGLDFTNAPIPAKKRLSPALNDGP